MAGAARRYLGAFDHSSGTARFNGEEDLLRRLSSTGQLTIVDCGANVGSWTLSARREFPHAVIHAIEPIAESVVILRAAIAHDPKVVVHPIALSDRTGVGSMGVDDRDRATATLVSVPPEAGAVAPARRRVSVPVTTGDRFLDEQAIAHIDLLKIDAEGHDLAVLRGFGEALHKQTIDVVQFEISGWNAVSRTWVGDFYDLLDGAGYVIGRVVPGGAELLPYRSTLEDFSRTQNFVAVRSELPETVRAVTGAFRSWR